MHSGSLAESATDRLPLAVVGGFDATVVLDDRSAEEIVAEEIDGHEFAAGRSEATLSR
ncbi:MAG: hypothetical protein WBA45_15355 [Microthrixaceae bacterium]